MVLNAFLKCLKSDLLLEEQIIPVMALKEGMFLTQDLYTKANRLVLCKGQETTTSICNKLSTLLKNSAIHETIAVYIKNEEATPNADPEIAESDTMP
jgi:hypothetical protein